MTIHDFLPRNQAGTEIYSYQLARQLARSGQEILLFFAEFDPSQRQYRVNRGNFDGIGYVRVINNHLSQEFVETYLNHQIGETFREILNDFRPDLIHCQHLMNLSLDLPLIARQRKIPNIYTLHDYWLICPNQGLRLKPEGLICDSAESSVCARCLSSYPRLIGQLPWLEKQGLRILPYLGPLARTTANLGRIARVKLPFFFSRSQNHHLPVEDPIHFQNLVAAVSQRNNLFREVCSAVDLFLAPSEFIRGEFVHSGIPPEKIFPLTPGIEPPATDDYPTRKVKTQKPKIGFIGTLVPHKGLHVLLEAMSKIPPDRAELKIFGNPSVFPQYMNRLRRDYPAFASSFFGPFSHNEIGKILNDLNLLVVPSVWLENAPLIIQEATAVGIPVIASRLGGMIELTRLNQQGKLFLPADADDLAKKIREFLQQWNGSGPGPRRPGSFISIEEHGKKIESIYQKLLS